MCFIRRTTLPELRTVHTAKVIGPLVRPVEAAKRPPPFPLWGEERRTPGGEVRPAQAGETIR